MPDTRELVTSVLTRYLRMCDVPAPAGAADGVLGDLFTEDAVWEGAGPVYAGTFGRVEGRPAIVAMLSGYLPPSPHFQSNVHLLFPGTIDSTGTTARGSWLMQQLSCYRSGTQEIMVARLDVTFRLVALTARISTFRTERLFSAPLAPADLAALLPQTPGGPVWGTSDGRRETG